MAGDKKMRGGSRRAGEGGNVAVVIESHLTKKMLLISRPKNWGAYGPHGTLRSAGPAFLSR